MRNAIHNASLKTLTLGTPFPCVPSRNDLSDSSNWSLGRKLYSPVVVVCSKFYYVKFIRQTSSRKHRQICIYTYIKSTKIHKVKTK